MTEALEASVARLSASDRKLFITAREYPSGVWLGGPCRHLYGDGLCRMTGELTERGVAVRAHLLKAPHLAIGDDNVEFQNLDQCATDLNYTAKSGTKITFGTQRALTRNGTDKLGLVVWLDRKAVADAIAAEKRP